MPLLSKIENQKQNYIYGWITEISGTIKYLKHAQVVIPITSHSIQPVQKSERS